MTTDNGGWRWQKEVINQNFKLNPVTSTFRSGSVAAGGGLDYHSQGYAVDIGGPNLMAVFNWLVQNYPQSQEIIYSPAGNRQIKNGQPHLYGEPTRSGHFTHVHWAYVSKSAVAPGSGGTAAPNATSVNAVGDTVSGISATGQLLAFIADPGTWKRVGLALGGIVLLFFGLREIGK